MCKKKRKICINCGNVIFNKPLHSKYCKECWKIRRVYLIRKNNDRQKRNNKGENVKTKKSTTFRVCIIPNCGEAVHRSNGFRCYKHRIKKLTTKEKKLQNIKKKLS